VKALPVAAELEVKRERGQRVNAPETAEPRDGRPPRPIFCQAREPLRDRGLARAQAVNGRDQISEYQL